MINSRRRALLKKASTPSGRLPEEYQEVGWLKATGTQYCRTDYYPEYSSNKKILMKGDLTLLDESSTQAAIGANFYTTQTSGFGIQAYRQIVSLVYGWLGTYVKSINIPEGAFSEGHFDIHFEINEFTVVLNNDTFARTRINYTSTVPIMIGAVYDNGSGIVSNNVLYKTISIYDGTELLTDIVPCYRKSDGKPGFYQMNVPEGGTNFITNLGSGSDFLIGPDV